MVNEAFGMSGMNMVPGKFIIEGNTDVYWGKKCVGILRNLQEVRGQIILELNIATKL